MALLHMHKSLVFGVLALSLCACVSARAEELLDEDELQKAYRQAVEKFKQEQPEIVSEDLSDVTADSADEKVVQPKVSPVGDEPTVLDGEKFKPYGYSVTKKPESNEVVTDEDGVATIKILKSAPYKGRGSAHVALEDLQMTLDMENVTLKRVLTSIVERAEEETGPWEVRWRLKPSNNYLMREKVNLTAEATFGQFLEYLVDRVNNMTGIRLFVSVFNGSRIIIISDTYY